MTTNTNVTDGATTVILAHAYADDSPESTHRGVRARLFGRLADLAADVTIHYRSDLFHDATWLTEHIGDDSLTFYYGVRPTGTSIGTDRPAVSSYNTGVYRIEYVVAGERKGTRTFTVTITDITDQDGARADV